MPKFNVLSGTWYHIEAPDLETAEEAYDAYFGTEPMPEGCIVREGEVDSHWDWEDIDDKFPDTTTPKPPKGFEPAW